MIVTKKKFFLNCTVPVFLSDISDSFISCLNKSKKSPLETLFLSLYSTASLKSFSKKFDTLLSVKEIPKKESIDGAKNPRFLRKISDEKILLPQARISSSGFSIGSLSIPKTTEVTTFVVNLLI